MFSVLAFLFTFGQMAVILGSYALQAKVTFYLWVVYGSPFYLLMTLLGNESAVTESNNIWLLMGLFHVLKYATMFKARLNTERPGLFYSAVVLEVAYLGMSGYYIN